MNLHADILFRLANEMMADVEWRMNRTRDGVLTHAACFNARQSIFNYLRGYLLVNDIAPNEPATLVSLWSQCKQIDSNFDQLDLAPIQCRDAVHRNDLCLDRNQVNECWNIAKMTRTLVSKELPVA